MKQFMKSETGMIVVEATILFPIMIMIIMAITILSMYLPTRAVLQNITQETATAIAIQSSDTWINYGGSEGKYEYSIETDKGNLPNVYVAAIKSVAGLDTSEVEQIVKERYENSSFVYKDGELEVEVSVVNWVVYREITITATQTFETKVNLEFIGFPTEIPISVTSCAVVNDGDEFVRNIDMLVVIAKKTGIVDSVKSIFSGFEGITSKISDFLGW